MIMTRAFYLVLIAGFLFTFDATAQRARAARAAQDGWELLGSKNVSWQPEKDVLTIGASEGGFKKLKIKVTGGTVYVARMVVTYGNGTKDEIPLKYTFRKGAESRTIDLQGGARVIKKITFIYDRKSIAKNAKIWVAGKK
jgi:hypothetical protein